MPRPPDQLSSSAIEAKPVTQPLTNMQRKKIEQFLHADSLEKRYRVKNVETIYQTAQALIAQVYALNLSTPEHLSIHPDRPVERSQPLKLQVRDNLGVLYQTDCRLQILLTRGAEVSLNLFTLNQEKNEYQLTGYIEVSPALPNPPRFPAIFLKMLHNYGNGLAAGLSVSAEPLCQLVVDTYFQSAPITTITIIDKAADPQSTKDIFSPYNLRRRWTSGIVTLSEGWRRNWFKVVLQTVLPVSLSYKKDFHPQKIQS